MEGTGRSKVPLSSLSVVSAASSPDSFSSFSLSVSMVELQLTSLPGSSLLEHLAAEHRQAGEQKGPAFRHLHALVLQPVLHPQPSG